MAGAPRRIALEDEARVAGVAERVHIEMIGTTISVDGMDVTRAIRTPEIDRAAASVARLPAVRTILVARQRELAADGGIVMEGRDIGTVVFPQADVKIYLDASAEERAADAPTIPRITAGPIKSPTWQRY